MIIEIHMRIEILPVKILVRPATYVFRIVEQPRNACDAAHHIDEFVVPHEPVEAAVGGAQLRQIGDYGFASRLTALVDGCPRSERGELRHQLLAGRRIEKRLDYHVAEGLSRRELRAQILHPISDGFMEHQARIEHTINQHYREWRSECKRI